MPHASLRSRALACWRRPALAPLAGLLILADAPSLGAQPAAASREIAFTSHDGHAMRGKLTLPAGPGPHAVVIYAQTAEGMTVDMRRRLSDTTTFDYFDLYAKELPAMQVGFFRYDGRGIGMGDRPPRFETIDTAVFNTGTLDNKVQDLLAALRLVRAQPGVDPSRVFLMGASEGTLLVASAAARAPREVAGLVMYGVLAANMRETFRYIMTDGAFLPMRRAFDADGDGRITPAEYEADPRRYRARALRNAAFTAFDLDRDSLLTLEDTKRRTKVMIDAIDQENHVALEAWGKIAAAVALPRGWFRDHFAYPPMWSFLEGLDMPMGLFHGDLDVNTPVYAVRAMEERAKAAGKSRMRFHYFPEGDHSLGIGLYFVRGTIPPGHQAIFGWIREHAAAR